MELQGISSRFSKLNHVKWWGHLKYLEKEKIYVNGIVDSFPKITPKQFGL